VSYAKLPYGLYGLADENPYTHHELDPLMRPADRKRWLDLDGFVDRELVVSHLWQAAENKGPAFVLIGGRNRTGRTSTANWVMDRYCDLRGVGERFVRVSVPVDDFDEFRWLRGAMVDLGDEVTLAVPNLTQQVLDGMQEFSTIDKSAAYEQKFRTWLRALSVSLASRAEPYAFGVLFERVREPQFVAAAKRIFAKSQAAVVFTYDDYAHAQTADAERFEAEQFDDIAKVYLRPLAGRQVCLLAQGRWEEASQLEFPFDADGLEHYYRNRATPIRTVLKRLEDVLNYRLELAAPNEIGWPENKGLFMSRKWLAATLELVEKSKKSS
jgi:hypothetical protein